MFYQSNFKLSLAYFVNKGLTIRAVGASISVHSDCESNTITICQWFQECSARHGEILVCRGMSLIVHSGIAVRGVVIASRGIN